MATRRAGSLGSLAPRFRVWVGLLALGLGGGRAVADPATTSQGPVAGPAQTLAARQEILSQQAAMARLTARWRARELYRFLRAGGDLPIAGGDRARTLATGARALARERHEEQLLLAERDLTRAEQAALLGDGEAAPGGVPVSPRAAGPAPRLLAPLAGRLGSRFGAARDPATGAWFFRAGLRIDGRAGQPVRAPAAGVVRRVVAKSAQGPALVIDHGGGWISVLANLDLAALPAAPRSGARPARGSLIVPGMRVAAGQVVGQVGAAAGGVTCELWRGRTPVDPAAFIHF